MLLLKMLGNFIRDSFRIYVRRRKFKLFMTCILSCIVFYPQYQYYSHPVRPERRSFFYSVFRKLHQVSSHSGRDRESTKKLEEEFRNLSGWLRQNSGNASIPSVVVTLVHGDTVMFKQAVRTSSNRLFPAASHTKFFTTLAILHLADRGLLNLDDPIWKYIPVRIARESLGSPPVTIRHLMSHTSGIMPGSRYMLVPLEPPVVIPMQLAPAGSKFHYTNAGYNLLGLLVPALTGESLGAYVRENIVRPLELPNALAPDTMMGASGFRWSLNDMIIFIKMFLAKGMYKGRRIVSERWFTRDIYVPGRIGQRLASHKTFRGVCWRVLTIDDRPYAANHASLWAGSGGWFHVYPKLNIGFIIMTDSPWFGQYEALFYNFHGQLKYKLLTIAGMLSATDLNPLHFGDTYTTSDILKVYPGRYVNPLNGTALQVMTTDSQVIVEGGDQERCELLPLTLSRFFCGKNKEYNFIMGKEKALGLCIGNHLYVNDSAWK